MAIASTRIINPWEKSHNYLTQICALYLHLCTPTNVVSWRFLLTITWLYDCVSVGCC